MADWLRFAGDCVPTGNVAQWVPWVEGFDANPKVAAGPPVMLSFAQCTPNPVATLTARAAIGATSLSVASAVAGAAVPDLLNAANKRLVLIDAAENAHVTLATSSSLTIDTDPTVVGNQGLHRSYPAGTPLCRVDVLSFSVQTDPTLHVPALMLDANDGLGAIPIADLITGFQVTTLSAGKHYELTMTATSELPDPMTGVSLTRTLRSDVTLRNG